MDMKEYLEASERTAPKGQEIVLIDLERKEVLLSLTGALGIEHDVLKRAIFYKAPPADCEKRLDMGELKASELALTVLEADLLPEIKPERIDLLHGILGVISEAGELAEEFVKAHLENREINLVNVQEELGDLLWYIALMLRNINSDFETVAAKNIAKLKKRFPEKFNTDNALTRDLFEEEKALKEG